jgi:hypothetical protein
MLIVLLVGVFVVQCGDDHGTGPGSEVVARLMDEEHEADSCVIVWTQADDDGNQVAEGRYFAHMTAEDYDFSAEFEIQANTPHVPALFDSSFCANEQSGGSHAVPVQFRVATNESIYAIGDTVCIIITLSHGVADLQLRIER